MTTGDYWPGEAENLLGNISEEQRQAGRKSNKGSLTAGGKPRAKSAKVSPLHHVCLHQHSCNAYSSGVQFVAVGTCLALLIEQVVVALFCGVDATMRITCGAWPMCLASSTHLEACLDKLLL